MHPALSVIFFTTISGAGYGLLALLGVFAFFDLVPEEQRFGMFSIGVALVLITAGLLCSTLHLGHPQRAWRALSQWRSSWLSREGVLAILTYIPALVFGFGWALGKNSDGIHALMGLLAAGLCIATVYSTAMIYASLKTIPAWNNHWVPLVYLALSVVSGLVLLNFLLLLFGVNKPLVAGGLCLVLALAWYVKTAYWRHIENLTQTSTMETATGLGHLGKVSLLQAPHDQENYVQKALGFRIARKHADKLRRISIVLAFALPMALSLLLLMQVSGWLATIAGLLSCVSVLAGIFIERWLFFAQARHSAMLYYGAQVSAQ